MVKVFLTGDRSLQPLPAVAAAADVLALVGHLFPDITVGDISTGDLDGFEAAVRYLAPGVGIVESNMSADGGVDFDARHARIAESLEAGDEVWFIHGDPLASSIYKSLVKNFSDDALRVLP